MARDTHCWLLARNLYCTVAMGVRCFRAATHQGGGGGGGGGRGGWGERGMGEIEDSGREHGENMANILIFNSSKVST